MTSKQQKRIEREEWIIRMFGHTLPLNKFRGESRNASLQSAKAVKDAKSGNHRRPKGQR